MTSSPLTPDEEAWLTNFERSVRGDYNNLTQRIPPRLRERVENLLVLDSLVRRLDAGFGAPPP